MDENYTYLIVAIQITLQQSAQSELGFSTYERAHEVYQSLIELHNAGDSKLINVTDDWGRHYCLSPNNIVTMHMCRGHESAKWAAEAKTKKEAWNDHYDADKPKLGFGR